MIYGSCQTMYWRVIPIWHLRWVCTATHDHQPTWINNVGPCTWLVVSHDHFHFRPIHNIDTANPFHTLGPSVTYGTSANPFQTLSPSPTKFRSHDRYTPFMCGPGHSNMLAQTIPKSRSTHYLRNLGQHVICELFQISAEIRWPAFIGQMYNQTGPL